MKRFYSLLGRFKKILMVGVALVLLSSANAFAATYFIYDDWGGTWTDVDKSGADDSSLCWAAASSNVLNYTGWGAVAGSSAADLFSYFNNAFSNGGSLENYAYEWWFSGTYVPQGESDWAQVEDPSAGAFYTDLDVDDYMRVEAAGADGFSNALSLIDAWMEEGYGVSLGIFNADIGGHSITAWGFEYDELGNYTGIYVTDSDDNGWDYYGLQHYALSLVEGLWYLDGNGGYYSGDADFISDVVGLKIMTSAVPVPSSLLLTFCGLLFCAGAGMRRRI
ncbi:IdeS/Mac family cysteine endopeptidase [Desulfobacter curvatus]|uniref:IdeS/Mac family cysteine endopeptidase n=1 Tax=Desulfobacter curvatus TaxID=2290 RepID=UPI00036023B3|nr:IdeS/Mac family cysteine endopeptidase [Desulfobacter curvatus]